MSIARGHNDHLLASCFDSYRRNLKAEQVAASCLVSLAYVWLVLLEHQAMLLLHGIFCVHSSAWLCEIICVTSVQLRVRSKLPQAVYMLIYLRQCLYLLQVRDNMSSH